MQKQSIGNTAAEQASRFINNTGKHIFLTGKAGTGKTTFLKKIISGTFKKAVIAAPTGIAAINAGGVTIHSLFQLPFGAFVPDNSISQHGNTAINTPSSILRQYRLGAIKRKLLQELELLIIDEVSMLRADIVDAIDIVLRTVRKNKTVAFGGVQVLFIGDLLQLPPVVKDDEWNILKNYYKSIYFFEAKALRQSPPLYIELEKIYRQADDTFITILNNLRNNQVTAADIQILNSHYREGFQSPPGENYIQLTTHNNKADQLNRTALERLPGELYSFKASVEGDFSEYAFPVDPTLELKKNAQVMFIRNDNSSEKKFFNGKIGIVRSVSATTIDIGFNDSATVIQLEKHTWKNIRYVLNPATNEVEENVVGTFTHFPVKLAWAITIHKSQGLTFSKAIVDIGNAFAPGQVYVALSRLTSLEGLVLSSPLNIRSLQVDHIVSEYAVNNKKNDQLDSMFNQESRSFFRNYISSCFDLSGLCSQVIQHAREDDEEDRNTTRKKHSGWAGELLKDVQEARTHGDRFLLELSHIFTTDNYLETLATRVSAAKTYFSGRLKEYSSRIKKQVEKVSGEKKVRQYVADLEELETIFFRQLQLVIKAEKMVKLAAEQKEFTSQDLNTKDENSQRMITPVKKRKGEKKPKISTKEISFSLYQAGKSVEDIAIERSLSIVTIEGHLAHYISLGKINVTEFLEQEKVDNILSVARTLNTRNLTPILQALGDEYSYTDIRFSLASDKSMEIK